MKNTDALITERLLAFLVCSAVLLTFLVVRSNYLFIERLWPDEALYAWYAEQIGQHPGFIFSSQMPYPPLFPLLLLLGKLFVSGELAYRFIMLAIGTIGIVAMYQLGGRVSGHFLGAFCALTLAFNHPYFLMGTMILMDVPLGILFILLASALLNIREDRHGKADGLAAAACSAIVLTKWSGILFLPLVGTYYYLAFPNISRKERAKRLGLTLLFPCAMLVVLILKNAWLTGKGVLSITALKGAYFILPMTYYFQIFPQLLAPFLIPFLLFGLAAVWKYERKVKVLLISWLVIFFPVYCLVPEKDPRYVLPVIPCFILLAGIGLETAVEWLTKNHHARRVFLQIFLFVCLAFLTQWNFVHVIEQHVLRKTLAYTGLGEAGEWLNRRLTKETIVFASSTRAMRYYTGLQMNTAQGRLYTYPKEREEFARIINTAPGPVYLEVDSWEYTQPPWIFPMTEEKKEQLHVLGFSLEHAVIRPALYHDEIHPANVIWIFKRKN